MIKQFNNLSSWRKDEITIGPHEMGTISFLETTPNIFVITNSNSAKLKVSISHLPRVDNYEFKVEPNCTETVGRPTGTKNLYILNDSSKKVNIIVFSIETEFDPQILKNLNIALDGGEMVVNSEISGVAQGVTLPVNDSAVASALTDVYGGKSLASLHQVLSMMNTKLGENSGGQILSKLDQLIEKKVSLDGSGITLNGVQTDLSSVHSFLTDIKNLLSYMDNKSSDTLLTAISTATQTSAGNTAVLTSAVDTLSSKVAELNDKFGKGQLFAQRFTPAQDTDLTIIPTSEFSRFSKIYYLRAVQGNFTFQLAGLPTDTVSTMSVLTLDEGDSLNDISTDVYKIIVCGANANNILEIVGEMK